jgi:hypothetical protein
VDVDRVREFRVVIACVNNDGVVSGDGVGANAVEVPEAVVGTRGNDSGGCSSRERKEGSDSTTYVEYIEN